MEKYQKWLSVTKINIYIFLGITVFVSTFALSFGKNSGEELEAKLIAIAFFFVIAAINAINYKLIKKCEEREIKIFLLSKIITIISTIGLFFVVSDSYINNHKK